VTQAPLKGENGHTQLAAAREQGCDLALTITSPGSDSQRNMERMGFRLAYTKAILVGA